MTQKLLPLADHLLILPDKVAEGEETNIGLEHKRQSGLIEVVTKKEMKEAMKRVNKGAVQAFGETIKDSRLRKLDTVVLYYPFAKNDVILGEVTYHLVREEDCMAVVVEA